MWLVGRSLHRCWGIRGVWGPPWWWTGGEGGMRMRKWRGKIYILRILHIYKIDYILSSSFCQAPGNDVLHHCADPYDFIPRIGGNYNLIRVCSSPAGPSFSAQLGLTSWLPGKHKRKSSLNNCWMRCREVGVWWKMQSLRSTCYSDAHQGSQEEGNGEISVQWTLEVSLIKYIHVE